MALIHNASSDMPYWAQGNAELDTQENLTKRQSLRQHPDVVDTIQIWWATAQGSVLREDDETGLHKDKYICMSKKMYKVAPRSCSSHPPSTCCHA